MDDSVQCIAIEADLLSVRTEGWARLDEASRQAFETLIESMAAAGVEIVRRHRSRRLDLLENAVSEAGRICLAITGWENRWYQRNIVMDSIVITDAAGIVVYAEGLDYSLRSVGEQIEIRRVLGGAIAEGQ